jgi:hypothetical protein
MVFVANLIAARLPRPTAWFYVPLLASLLLLYFVPRDAVLSLPLPWRLAWSLLFVPLPIFFAGLIFSTTFRAAEGAAASLLFGANLVGAMIGGFCEYLGMMIGTSSLTLLAAAAYVASLLLLLLVNRRSILARA